MKKLVLALFGLMLCNSAAAAEANRDVYVGGFALLGFADTSGTTRSPAQPTPLDESSDTAGINGGAGLWLGYNFASLGAPIRTELAGTWRFRHDMNVDFVEAGPGGGLFSAKSNVQTVDLMASALYDIPVNWAMKPYVGGGIGMTYVSADTYLLNPAKIEAGSSHEWNFTWQLQGGVNYALSEAWDFRVDYRYVDMGRFTTPTLASGDRFSSDLDSHDIRIGATYSF